ncbi:LysE family transporter, partial [Pseudomonas syringae group genomosp. 7]|uniref:LysE family transporter n=1 Tax=Pseudomonas syringae group genomosp. 7 TaxID=251699 RepID=UPI00376F8133
YSISAGLKHRVLLHAVGALFSCYLLATLIVGGGVGTLVAYHPVFLSTLTVAGAGFLLWLGANMLTRPATAIADETREPGSWKNWALKG